ncbi:HD-GYP domain-containing protein [Sulfuriflexus mobilis]|uniref:HD-GYP domain-containing protein n=1 Tax=Sulfuriflexus mobilis TaxID=1811807 RepID=UPI000F8256C3|nr:HD-GYP domain-containing protein [Sulfuriflexus mobilis]
MKRQIDIMHLKQGMYVAELDRPWLESPFLFQGFVVDSDEDLQTLKSLCEYVHIDLEKGDDVDVSILHAQSLNKKLIDLKQRSRPEIMIGFEQEIAKAREVHEQTRMQIDTMFLDVRMGKNLDVSGAKEVVSDMVDSIVRNPDAMQWLTNLRKRDEYTAIHSMNVCIFSLTFGRYLGLTTEELNELGIGALLHDIGKMRVPLEILNKEGKLTDEEYTVVRSHASYGHEILKKTIGLPTSAAEIARSHHERKNGEGYPRGLKEEEIHLYARVVSIVDIYDAITSDRIYHHGMNTLDALKNMFEWRVTDLDSELVERFIQCLGIYPIGSLVELNSEEVGIVISVAQGRRLTPMIMLVRNAEKRVMMPPKVIDLSRFKSDESAQSLEICRVLEPNTYGIDVREYISSEVLH